MIYRDKVIAITGGSGDIALGVARHMLQCGASKISLLDRTYFEIEMTKLYEDFPNQEVFFFKTNVTNNNELKVALRETVFRFGGVDIVMTCAGVLDEHSVDDVIDVNLRAVIHTNYIAMDLMNQENGGRGGLIVNISSVSGVDCSQFSTPSYNATKHAVVAFTRSMGDEFFFRKYGVKFITICPGITLTSFLDDLNERAFSLEAFDEAKQKCTHVPQQTISEFTIALKEALTIARNGSVWLIDGGKIKEIKFLNHWVDSDKIA